MRRPVASIIVFCLTLVVGFIAGTWYSNRQHQTRWNTSALRPFFRTALLEGETGKQSPIFFYQLENTTNEDYSIREMSDVELFVSERGAIDSWMGSGRGLTIDLPVFVPAKQKANITVHFKVVDREQPASDSQADVAKFLSDKNRIWNQNQYDGIVLLDMRKHYRIDFPFAEGGKVAR